MARTTAAQARSDILLVAARLFADRGYEATSVQDIASALGASKATVLYHFHGKAMILHDLMVPAAAALSEMLDEVERLPEPERPRATAVRFVDAVIAFRNALASYPAAVRRIVEIPELADLDFAGLGERLERALVGPTPSLAGRAAMVTTINGVLAAAQSLDGADPETLRSALAAVALRALGHSPAPVAP